MKMKIRYLIYRRWKIIRNSRGVKRQVHPQKHKCPKTRKKETKRKTKISIVQQMRRPRKFSFEI